MRFEGVTAIVTGASSGVGLATARALAREGARVALLARRAGLIRQYAAEIGNAAVAVECDVSDEESVNRAVAEAEGRLGEITALVNNAGFVEPGRMSEMSTATWDTTFEINTRGTFLMTKRVLAGMLRAGRGSIVNVSSISGVIGPQKFPGFTAYCASKAAVIAMTEVLGIELAGTGVRANAVSPGSVDTPMWAGVSGGSPAEMTPDELAHTILFLLSDESRPMNGRNVDVWS